MKLPDKLREIAEALNGGSYPDEFEEWLEEAAEELEADEALRAWKEALRAWKEEK